MMKPGMTYNQLRELDKGIPTPVEYNPPDEPEFIPDMSEKVQGKVDELRNKLMAVRSKAGSK
jgi:hypothetical protein